jgi:hypothetical protein
MTLILTEISNLGIAMAADSAVTIQIIKPDGTMVYRVLTGVRKLQVIDKLNAGIAVWGLGQIDNLDTDIWLQDFINSQRENYNTLNEFAILLQNEVRNTIPPINFRERPLGTIGFHLAGFVDHLNRLTATFYHIHNGISQTMCERGITINPAIVNANHDLPPDITDELLSSGRHVVIRNGDIAVFAPFIEHIGVFFGNLSRHGLTIPDSRNLIERAEWLKFEIRTMSEIYRFSNLHLPTIGGKIDTLLITPNGVDGCGLTL